MDEDAGAAQPVPDHRGHEVRLGLNFGYWCRTPSDSVPPAREAERLGYHSAWTAEAWGSDAVSPLTRIAARTERIAGGTAVMQMTARIRGAATCCSS